MGRAGRKKNFKRKKGSSSGDEEQWKRKQPKQGGPAEFLVSDILNQTNSVLYEDDHPVFDLSMEHSTPLLKDSNSSEQVAPSSADIMKFLNKIDAKLSEVTEKLKVLDTAEKKVNEFDADLKQLRATFEKDRKDHADKMMVVNDRLENLEFSGGELFDKLERLENDNKKLQEKMTYLQSKSMRNNLIFTNLPEDENERSENTERKLRQVLVDKLKMAQDAVDNLKLERVHRMGIPRSRYSRNIVCKFSLFKDREEVRKRSSYLKGTNFFVQEQFPSEIVEKRKLLLPKLKEAKRDGKKAWLSYDTLYVDGKPFKE